jgi:hypothetical protein
METAKPPPCEDGRRVRRSVRLLWRRTPDGILVLRPGGRDVLHLLGTAVELWELLDTPRAPADVVAELAQQFGAPEEQVGDDVRRALADLVTRGVVEPCPG